MTLTAWFALTLAALITTIVLLIGSLVAYRELYDRYCRLSAQQGARQTDELTLQEILDKQSELSNVKFYVSDR